jgi:hypothetical protein
MLTMTLSQHLTLHWLNLQIEATHTQDEGFERDSRDQTCSLVFVGSVDLVLISRMLVLHLCMFRGDLLTFEFKRSGIREC